MGSSWWTIEVYGCVRPYHSEGFLQFLVDLRGARMCQTRACEELSISERILVSSCRIPRVSLMSEVLKCDQCDQKVSLNGAVTHDKCSQERRLSKENNYISYHANSHHAHTFGITIKAMPVYLTSMENLTEEAPPVYEELSIPSGMETLDIRVGLSRMRMEREKEQFHEREVMNLESDDVEETTKETDEMKEEEEGNKGTSTLDIRVGLSKSKIVKVKNYFDNFEPSLEHINGAFSNDEDPKEEKEQNKMYAKEKSHFEPTRNSKRTGESLTKHFIRKLDRMFNILLCKS